MEQGAFLRGIFLEQQQFCLSFQYEIEQKELYEAGSMVQCLLSFQVILQVTKQNVSYWRQMTRPSYAN